MNTLQNALTNRVPPPDAAPGRQATCPSDPAEAARLAEVQLAFSRPQAAFRLLAQYQAAHGPHASLLRLSARALLAMKLHDQAIGALYAALEMTGMDAELLGLLGEALVQAGQPGEALAPSQTAFRLRRTVGHATTLSCILLELGHDADALRTIDVALQDSPGTAELWLNRAMALEALDRDEEALHSARHALDLAPKSAVVRHHLAAVLLIRGQMTPEAWDHYEGRLGLEGGLKVPSHAKQWRGEDAGGKTILVHAEQGFGDTLQFVRYVPLVAARGVRVVLAVQPGLASLLQGTPGAAHVLTVGEKLPPFDFFVPLLSLPGLLGTTLATIPPPLPYAIKREPRPAPPLHVGLAWAGNPAFIADRQRSVSPELLAPLADVPGVVFHNLQFGASSSPAPLRFATTLDGIGNFSGTASRIAMLDLVITVDTAIAHLAGTIGVPVWLLSRFRGCWRWLRDREDSPWYPAMRIWRQTKVNDWAGVIAAVQEGLAELARRPGAPPV